VDPQQNRVTICDVAANHGDVLFPRILGVSVDNHAEGPETRGYFGFSVLLYGRCHGQRVYIMDARRKVNEASYIGPCRALTGGRAKIKVHPWP
jgi:hypothetical protein